MVPAGTEGNASKSSESKAPPEAPDETDTIDVGLSAGELTIVGGGSDGASSDGTGGICSEAAWRASCSIRRKSEILW